MIGDYVIFQRDRTGALKKRLIDVSSVDILEKVNDVGSWNIKSVTDYACPFAEGDGIIIFRDGRYCFSGFMLSATETYDSYTDLYTWEVSGVSDLAYLNRRVCYPDPEGGDTTAVGYYTDSGRIADVVKRLIDKNVGISALPERREAMVAETVVDERGENVSVSLRFSNLLETVVGLLDEQAMTIRVMWDDDAKKVYYQTFKSADLSESLLFSVELNTLERLEHTLTAPDGNYVISAGQGELTERSFAYAVNSVSVSKWGRIEYYHDMRATVDAELQTDADVTLSKFSDQQEGYTCDIPISDGLPQYRTDWDLGDFVTVAHGNKLFVERVLQVKTRIDATTETITPAIGTVTESTLKKIFGQLGTLRSDVEQLQNVSR